MYWDCLYLCFQYKFINNAYDDDDDERILLNIGSGDFELMDAISSIDGKI